MNDNLIRQICSSIANDEINIIKNRLVNEELSSNDKKILLGELEGLQTTSLLCNPHVKSDAHFGNFIQSVGLDNVCRYYNNLCALYTDQLYDEYTQGNIGKSNSYILKNPRIGEKVMPLTTKSGDPSNDINSMFGIYKDAVDMSQDEKSKMSFEFSQTADMLLSYINTLDTNGISEDYRKSMELLVSRGTEIISTRLAPQEQSFKAR